MTHFMANHRFDFVVRHHIHQAAIYTNTAVRHREGIHIFRHVDLVVDRLSVDVIAERRGDFVQALRVLAAGWRDSRFTIHFRTGLVA